MKLITQHLPIKKAKVHRLPTEDKGVIVIRADKPNVLMLERNSPYAVYGKGGSYESKEHTYQHLYFTTDEDIKEGDWFLNDGNIHQWDGTSHNPNEFELDGKIIASTDPKLTTKKCSNCNGKGHIDKDGFRDCHCKTGEVYNISQPTQDFIKAYCEQGGIDEVGVEYYDTDSAACVMIEPKDKSKGCINCNNEDGRCTTIKKLKLNSDNTVITHLIKPKSTFDILTQFTADFPLHRGVQITNSEIEDWIKENL